MRQINISVFFVLFFLKVMSQPNDTELLKKFVTSEEFCKYILPCKKCNSIVLVDTAGFFNIDSFSVTGQTIAIKRTGYPKNQFPLTKVGLIARSCCSLLITNYLKAKRKIRIDYFHYPTNGLGWVSYRFRNKKLKQTGFSYGQL